MPENYLEENRFLFIETRLGPNELLLLSFTGTEGISQLFSFQLELVSQNHRIKFEDVIGQAVSFGVSGQDGHEPRHIHGIVTAFTQLPSLHRLARYRAEVSPKLWLLTKRQQSRVFQQMSVPDILRSVLSECDIDSTIDVQGTFHSREYCVQYRETDFNFISRLMEEEGIFYFFRHSQRGHRMILANTPQSHADIPGDASLIYEEVEGGGREELRITNWEKSQHWGSGKATFRDYCFEMPTKDLEAEKGVLESVQVGRVTHKLKVAGNDNFEVYDYPGGYAKRFDSGDPGNVSKIFDDNQHLAEVTMQQMEGAQFDIRGNGYVHTMAPGFRFALTRHFNADGQYVITSVAHSAREGGLYSESADARQDQYANSFECIPLALPYRPPRVSRKPLVWGCQTATVSGSGGGEGICTDEFGRIKVQFHWNRGGSDSCWARVASYWAGDRWGAIHIPRIGQEVVVSFLEGDPDHPIVVGSVYNADNMPPYDLPGEKTRSGVKSQTAGGSGYNEICYEDAAGAEEIRIHAQKDLNAVVENDQTREIRMNDKTTVGANMTIEVHGNRKIDVMGKLETRVMISEKREVTRSRETLVLGQESLTVGEGLRISSAGPISITAPSVTISAGAVTISAPVVQVSGIVQCTTLVASVAVVSPSYSPGVGNLV
jgi:type VI secretion system secreted protein VgrG